MVYVVAVMVCGRRDRSPLSHPRSPSHCQKSVLGMWSKVEPRDNLKTFYVGSAEVVLLDATAVGSSVSADWRKKPSSVVHSRTVTVSVLAVTSVMLTLSIKDLTPGGGSHTSAWRLEWTGDQCAGLQRFTSGDPTSDDVVSPATVFLPTLPDSFLPASGVFLRAVLRSLFGPRRPLTSLFFILSRRTDDGDDVLRGERVVVECC